MKSLRYPLLLLAVIFIPTIFATLFSDALLSLPGYVLGYLMIHIIMRVIGEDVYSKRIRTVYLIINAIVALLILRALGLAIGLLYMSHILNPTSAILFIGLPWVALQMLLLFFFVQSENVLK